MSSKKNSSPCERGKSLSDSDKHNALKEKNLYRDYEKAKQTIDELRLNAKRLVVVAEGKERVRRELVVIAEKLRLKAKQLAVVAKEKEIVRRKLAVTALSSSEIFLNSVIEQSPESLWISDSEGTLIRMNQACHELFGITNEEAVGKYNLLKDNLIEEQGFMPLVEDVFRKGEIARFTIDYDLPRVEHIKVRKATHRILDVIISPIKDMHGKVTNAIVQHKDITERKQAEEELLKVNAFNSAIVENSPFGIMTIRPDGSVDYVNPAMLMISGDSRENFKDMNLFRLPNYIKMGLSKKIRACFNGKPFFLGPLEYVSHFSGKMTVRNFTGIPMRNKADEVDKVMLFIEDLTQIKEAEKKLRESEEKFRAFFEGATDGIMVADVKTKKFVFVNYAICELTGYSLKELLKLSVGDIHPTKDLPYVMAQVARQIKGEITLASNIPVLRKDKQVVYCDVNSKVMKIGERDYLVGFFRDITDRRKAEQLIKKSEEQSRLLAEETAFLNKIIVLGNEAEDLQGLMKSTLDETLKFLSFSGGGIYLKDSDENIVKLAYFEGLDAKFVKAVREIDIRKKPFSIIFLRKEAIFADDYAPYHPGVAKKFNVTSLASVPIFSRDEVIGALNVMSKKKHIFSEGEKRMLSAIGRLVGTSIVNRQAEENLKSRTIELEKFNQMTIGRELRMVELKKRIAELENDLKQKGTKHKTEAKE